MSSVYLTVLPVAIGAVALAFGALRRELMFRRLGFKKLKEEVAKALAIPEGMVEVQTGHLERRAGLAFKGTTMLVGAGTPSLKRMLDTLILVEREGLEDTVGSIFAYECTNTSLADFENRVPMVFRDRIVYASSRDFPNGFGNQPPEWVEGKIALWGVELADAVVAVVKLHEERNDGKPGQIIDFVSLGGHAFPGLYLIKQLHNAVPEAQVVGVVNLPRKNVQRQHFQRLKQRYEQAGVEAWLLSDQMEPDWVTQDSVVGALFAALTAASLGSDGAPAINNVISNAAGVTSGRKGGMVRFTYHYTDVVAHLYQVDTHGKVGYYVNWKTVESEVLKVIGEIEQGEGASSVNVPVRTSDVHIYDIIAIQLSPGVTRDIRDNVERARDLEDAQLAHKRRPHRHPTVDYETIYTSWALPINTTNPRCRILVVRLQELDVPLEVVVSAPADRPKNEDPTEDGQAEIPSPQPVPELEATTNGVVSNFDLEF